MTYWEVVPWRNDSIREVEIERETKATVWVEGRMCRKEGRFFSTQIDAMLYVQHQLRYKIEREEGNLEHAQKRLVELKTRLAQWNVEIEKVAPLPGGPR